MKNSAFFLLLTFLCSMLVVSAQETDIVKPRHVGTGNIGNHPWWMQLGDSDLFYRDIFLLSSATDPVFADEYSAFLNTFGCQKEKKSKDNGYLEPSFMEENVMNLDGSFQKNDLSSPNTVFWRLSFPSIPALLEMYHYQLIPGCEDVIIDGVKDVTVAQRFQAWRKYAQWRSHPTARVLVNYINFQLAAKWDHRYQEKVTFIKNSYLHERNGKDYLLFYSFLSYRGGQGWGSPHDEWQRYFDLCDVVVQGILHGINNPDDPFNEAYYPDLALFYITTDPATGTARSRHIIEFTADHDPSLPANVPLHAVCPYYQDPNEAIGYLFPEGAPELKIATHVNRDSTQLAAANDSYSD